MAGTSPVGTFGLTNISTQTPTVRFSQEDANSAVAQRAVDCFAPHPAATPAMSVVVDSGFVTATLPSGLQIATEAAQQTVTITTAPGVPNSRIDLIVVDAGTGVASAIAGTAATSPSAPAVPAGKLKIALVAVASGATSIGAAVITDVRAVWSGGTPGVPWCIGGGTPNAITAAYAPANTALTDGLLLAVRLPGANTSTTPTFTPDGLATHPVTKQGGGALAAGDLPGNLAEALLRFNLANARWELINPAAQTYSLTASGIAVALGYTPVQSGTGIGQTGTANVIKIGWSSGAKLKATVDSSDLGNIALESWVSPQIGNLSGSASVSTATAITLNSANFGGIVFCTGTGTFNVTVPAPTVTGQTVTLVSVSANTVSAVPSGCTIYFPNTLVSAGPMTVSSGYGGYLRLEAIGANWIVASQAVGTSSGGSTDSGGGSGSCFLDFCLVTMADGSLRRIDEIVPGDFVQGLYGEANEVLALERPMLGNRPMYLFNDHHWTTDDHPYWTPDGPAALQPKALAIDWGHYHDVITAAGTERRLNIGLTRQVRPLRAGDILYRDGAPRRLEGIKVVPLPASTQLYNLVLGGSHTYRVDGYAVTGWPREDDFDYDLWTARMTVSARRALGPTAR